MSGLLVTATPSVLGGKPVIAGTRISVAFILQCLASGMTVADILQAYPHLKKDGVLAAIDYAARALDGETIHPLST